MTKVNIGKNEGKEVSFDLDVLLRTRLLIQASSGQGKSWLLRVLAEQAFGKVQTIIIDVEGEFPTLREKYDFVLVGKGGETPADTRSAALVAHKLLELNASAVCDLYEMKASDRHRWVKLFLEAMIDAPKNLWHPVLVIVDEAHIFAPEKGAGESEASDAMIGLATRGRKRGFCAVFATQRLGKLRKDAAAELLNVMIGGTFIDVDRKRAADALGIPKNEEHAFFDDMKVMKPGKFWVLGRAISKDRILVDIADVQTKHPESGSSKFSSEPPPAPEKVKMLLPKLSDLPKEAEAKAKTEADLRKELTELKRQLSVRPTLTIPEVKVERIEIPVFQNSELDKLESIAKQFGDLAEQLSTASRDIFNTAKSAKSAPRPTMPVNVNRKPVENRVVSRPSVPVSNNGNGSELPNPQQRILDAIAWMESIGIDTPKQAAVAFLADYTYGGGAFNNPRGALRTSGLVEYVGDSIRMTDDGRQYAHYPDAPLDADELQKHVMGVLPSPHQKILSVLLEKYPEPISKEECASLSGYALGGAFNNPLGRLHTLELVDYPKPGYVVAKSFLFLESNGA
jgi:hypothetical protein